jgi:hypothetical protein
MLKIAIIIGSTRPGRNGEAVAKWVYEIAQKRTDAEFELVDIKDFDLPLLDEPVSPIMGQYSRPYQDLECIMPHDQLPSVGGVYAKLRGRHPAGREFTGNDGVN